MDKIYIGRDDWYSAYRRNRGPNGVMRKLVLESNRRKKASITFPPIPPELEGQDTMGSSGHNIDVGNDTTDDYASMVPRFGRESVTDSDPSSSFSGPNSKIRGVTGSNGDKDDEDDEDDDEDDDDEEEDQQESIQGVRKHSVVAVPVPVIVRPVGLIPKSRSGGNRSYGLPAGDGPNRVQLLVLQGIWMVSVVLVVDGFLR
ncbi:hypothetical protein BG003_010869 [Podila horticola]|nr:hypothetical protein BG003_010869 [Podila horticola]